MISYAAAAAVEADGGGTTSGHSHSYTSKTTTYIYRRTYASCTSAATYYYKCSGCSEKGTTYYSSGNALGHTGGSLGDYEDASYHYKVCTRSGCGSAYDGVAHSGGSWYTGSGAKHYKDCSTCGYTYTSEAHTPETNWYDGNDGLHYKDCTKCTQKRVSHGPHSGGEWYDGGGDYHYKDCEHCTKTKYTNGTHDSDHKEPTSDGDMTYQDTYHNTYCEACFSGKNYGTLTNKGVEEHPSLKYGERAPHTCTTCEHQIQDDATDYHYYKTLAAGHDIVMIKYNCAHPKCSASISLEGDFKDLIGLPLDEYTASDATLQMEDVPTLENGEYTLYWESSEGGLATLRDRAGNELGGLPTIPEDWIRLYGWGRKNLKTHVDGAEDYAKDTLESLQDYDWYNPGTQDFYEELIEKYKDKELITAILNHASENILIDWDPILKKQPVEIVKNGAEYLPEVTDNGKDTYTLDYQHGDGGWMFAWSPFSADSGYYYTDLFVKGEYEEEDPEPWIANIFYCYRTLDNQVPKNGFASKYTHKTVVVYNAGPIAVTETIYPDMNLINKAGYRYVGVSTQVSTITGIGPASAPPASSATSGTVTVNWPHNQAAAMVTFFVEPVKLSYGHKATDYNKNIIDIVASSSEGKNIEFPDYYVESEGKCIIPVNSLNKYWWPGYLLESSKAYKAGTKSIISGSEKTYNDSTTTVLEDSNRHVVTERVPSSYSSETKGFASDKEFYFFYNTPTIEIEHKKYGTNDYMTTTSGTAIKYIKYMQQIINQYAYIDSLITDGVRIPYTMRIRNAAGNTESFTYSYPSYDLVQVKIYEVKDNGSTVHYATLYEDSKYAQGSKCYKVNGYAGVFAKYYSESLNAIAGQIGKSNQVFNTNKNWKVEFIYDEVERVYIKFKDLKGNSIFIPDPNNEGKYIGEITAKIPDGGYSYTPPVLGNGRFTLVKYTIDPTKYVDDLTKSSDISQGTPVSVPANNGDRYIIFYYSTGKTLTIEYRDENENTIRPSKVVEIPTTGTVVEVPDIPLYVIDGYKHNPNYDGITTTIEGEKRPLTIDDKEISVPNPEETNHHVIIYYKSNEALKIECREEGTNKKLQPPPEYSTPTWLEIPELGTKVQVPTIAAYKAQYYLKNENYNGTDDMIDGPSVSAAEGTDVQINSNGNNQFLLIYYKKIAETTNLIIEYKEGSPTGPDIKEPSTIELPIGVETPISVPTIDEYEVQYYIIPTDPTPNPVPITEEDLIKIIGDPTKPEQKIIIVYVKPTDPTPDPGGDPVVITPDDNIERVYLRANNKGSEEYDAEVAIPTSEDLYVSGDVYAYRFVTKMEEKAITENVKVKIVQEYYKDLDDTSKRGSISVNLTLPLTYNYYNIISGDLYDLKALHLENEAIKYYNNFDYDTNTYGTYKEKEANFPVSDQVPNLKYELPTGIGQNENHRVQIKSTDTYDVKYDGTTFTITLKDVEYYKALDESKVKEQLTTEAMAILEKCTKIKVQTLKIELPGEADVDILTGEKYDLPNKADALKSPELYIPYVAGRTPLESFYYNKDLYVREEAENRNHMTTMTGDYRLVERIAGSEDATITTYNPATQRLYVEDINVNSVNVHTPIVNKVNLNTLENKNVTQLTDAFKKDLQRNKDAKILNLEEKFKITIKNTGDHINVTGYGDGRTYNHGGLTVGQTETDSSTASRIIPKSNDVLMTPGIIVNSEHGAYVDKTKIDMEVDSEGNSINEQNAIGPSYAEYKLIKFPYDVYLQNTDAASPAAGKPQLLKAGFWYNLYEYVKPSVVDYTFVIPTWVEDAKLYSGADGIHVLIVAENCSLTRLEEALGNPMGVKTVASNEEGKNNTYILRTSYNTYVSGRLYDLQIRDTDDPGYMSKIKEALDGNDVNNDYTTNEMPVAQKGQVAAYNMGMKLGYRIYFDLKTKGISNKKINIEPKIYYVSQNGATVTDDISLFYHSKGSMYNKLATNDLTIRMSLASSHGTAAGNTIYTSETIAAKQLLPSRIFTNQTIIGKLVDGLTLTSDTVKLPYDNLSILANTIGFGTVDALTTSAIGNAKTGSVVIMNENMIKDCSGHWYGEYYLPASTIVVKGAGATKEQAMVPANVLTNGYLVVVFEEITTESNGGNYLTYAEPTKDYENSATGESLANKTQWIDEGIDVQITLPNGSMANLEVVNSKGAPMAIYQVGLRANNDFETEGTH